MVVVEGVEDALAVAVAGNDALCAQEPQVLGDGRLRQPDDLGEVAGTELLVEQLVDDFDPRGVAERAVDLGGVGVLPRNRADRPSPC